TINFLLQPMDKWENNLIEGSRHTTEYQNMEKEIRSIISPLYDSLNVKRKSLEKEGKLYTLEAINLEKQMDKLAEGDPKRQQLREQYWKLIDEKRHLTPEAKALEDEYREIDKISVEKQIQYAKEHSNIVGYSILVANIRLVTEQTKGDVSPMLEIYNEVYKPKYPHHPYTALVESYINASTVRVGNACVDVTVADLDGKEVQLSELIQGKVALIHLWASWCGPCRKHGKEMIPVYEKYKDKGFTVIGIARERNKGAMLAALNTDKYPWVNFPELNDKHGIWTKFGIGNAGGGDFLVDDKGIFLSVNATSDEVKKILETLYDAK
ncbi:Thiol-disulfide oxidoreductase ResA, partial [termite gut metagenome]